MEEKKEIENYLKNLYEFYKKSNYKYFVEKCLSFNIKIGDFNKNINSLSKKVYDSLLNSLNNIDCRAEYRETFNYYYLKLEYSESLSYINKIIVDVPVFEENYEYVANIIYRYLAENKINFSMKLYKLLKNDYFKIEFYDFGQFKRFSEFFNMNSEINNVVKSRVIPFLNKSYYLGVYTEVIPYSFKNFYIKNLYLYFSYYIDNETEDGVNLDGFLNFVSNKLKTCKNLNEKRMYSILVEYLDISINSKDLSYLFDTNTIMSLASYSPNEFNLKLDDSKMIYFINKEDGEEIKYGSEDFLNIAYSKYYENVIKQEKNNKYYSDFYSIYNIILCTQYKEIDMIFSLLNDKMDIINRLLIVLSSAYFAHKKMNFPIKTVYSILDRVIPKVYDYKCHEMRNIELNIETSDINSENNINNTKNVSNEYIITEEIANKLVNLSDGKKISFKDYLEKYDILCNIKMDTLVHLKDGTTVSGKEFIDDLYKYISFYNSFTDLFEDMVIMLEYK